MFSSSGAPQNQKNLNETDVFQAQKKPENKKKQNKQSFEGLQLGRLSVQDLQKIGFFDFFGFSGFFWA